MSRRTVVGIGGATCSGKTTAAERLHKKYNCKNPIIHMDDYFNGKFIKHEGKMGVWRNLEDPISIDWAKFVDAIKKAKEEYTDAVIIVEGFLLYHNKNVCDLLDVKLYMQIDKETSYERRKIRGRDHKKVYCIELKQTEVTWDKAYMEEVIWPTYLKYEPKNWDGIVQFKCKN